MFIVMGCVNLFLMLQIKRFRKLSPSLVEDKAFKKEQKTLVIVLVIFEISYFTRFLAEELLFEDLTLNNLFMVLTIGCVAFIFDGVSFLVLLIVHYRNFKPQQKKRDHRSDSLYDSAEYDEAAHLSHSKSRS